MFILIHIMFKKVKYSCGNIVIIILMLIFNLISLIIIKNRILNHFIIRDYFHFISLISIIIIS